VRSNIKALQVWAPISVIGIVWSRVCKIKLDGCDMIWLLDATLTQLKICEKCWHCKSCQLMHSLQLYFPFPQIGSISATEFVNDILQNPHNTGPVWFSLVRCWRQWGLISMMNLDMRFTTLSVRSCLSRDNTITVHTKIMHFSWRQLVCAIGLPQMFCLGHFFSFKGLSYKVLMSYNCLLAERSDELV